MKSYHQYCPVARGAELFAERWTPIIIGNIKMGCHNFSEILRGAPGLSKTLLADRLRSLAQAGVVQVTPNPRGRGSVYHLTEAGEDLVKVVLELGNWGTSRAYGPLRSSLGQVPRLGPVGSAG